MEISKGSNFTIDLILLNTSRNNEAKQGQSIAVGGPHTKRKPNVFNYSWSPLSPRSIPYSTFYFGGGRKSTPNYLILVGTITITGEWNGKCDRQNSLSNGALQHLLVMFFETYCFNNFCVETEMLIKLICQKKKVKLQ